MNFKETLGKLLHRAAPDPPRTANRSGSCMASGPGTTHRAETLERAIALARTDDQAAEVVAAKNEIFMRLGGAMPKQKR